MAGKKGSGTRVRNAVNGRFATKSAAKKSPKTTVTETTRKKK